MKMWRYILVGLTFFGLFTGHSFADGFATLEEVRVVADRMEADALSNKVSFFGNVKAKQKDVVIYAQKLTLFYSRGDEQNEKGIERAELEGDVRIIQQERMATADKALFLNLERKIIMSGQAEIHQAGNVVKGDEIVYYIDEERSIVTSDPDSRVNAVINPKGDDR
jgi:lipopolysaccharide export system protein LptA